MIGLRALYDKDIVVYCTYVKKTCNVNSKP